MSPKTYSAMGDPKSITELIMGQRPHAFTGELMTCVICGATERSAPDKQTDWRAIDLDRERFYACPKEFPPDGATVSTAEAFALAYTKVIKAALEQLRQRRRKP